MANILGMLTGMLLLAQIGLGLFFRRRLGRRFRLIHRILAGLLGVALLGHAVLMYSSWGIDPSAWHYAGVAGLAVMLLAAGAAWFRRKIGRRWLTAHISLAVAALGLGLLHVILIKLGYY